MKIKKAYTTTKLITLVPTNNNNNNNNTYKSYIHRRVRSYSSAA